MLSIKFNSGTLIKLDNVIISLSKKATEHKFNGYTCTECFSVSSFFNNIAPLVNHHKFARLMMYV